MHQILIVEDEQDIADLIRFNLERAGYQVHTAADGISGNQLAVELRPDLIVLDLMLPGRDGFGVFKELRRDTRTADIPVLMLTARSQTEDRIKGLEAGADDYLTKPFSPKELMLRVQAILKRTQQASGGTDFSHGPFQFDIKNLKFYLAGDALELTSTEFKLLHHLCERAGLPQDRHELLRRIWGYSDAAQSRTLDTHMKRLRQKLGDHGSWIETVRGVGYAVAKSKP